MKKLTAKLLLLMLLLQAGCAVSEQEALFKQDYIKDLLNRVTTWQLKNPKHLICDWTNGALYTGVFAAWQTTGSQEIHDALMEMGEKTGWSPCGTYWWARANDFAISQTHIDLYRIKKDATMLRPLIDTLEVLMAEPSLFPKPNGPYLQKWGWCDALFMEPPALVKLGVTVNNPVYLTYQDELFMTCYDLLYDKEEHLFARDIRYVIKNDGKDLREANGQKIFWGRGNGWVAGGLARVLAELPTNYPKRPFYEKIFVDILTKIASLQQADGLWRCSLLDPDAYPGGETSGSGFYCYAMAWGINNGLLDKKTFLPVVEKAWVGLTGCVNEEGRVGWVQPIGDDPRKNFSKDSWEVYGTGAFLLAGSEVIKLKR